MTIGEKSKPVAFLSPPGRQGKQWSKRRDSRKQPVRAPKKAETTLSHHKSPVAALPAGPPASGFTQSIWALPSPSTGCACPPGRQHSRDAGVALLTRVELGWGGQSPGGGQGGLRTQRARQVGRCSTWTGGGQTDTSELVHSSSSRLYLFFFSLFFWPQGKWDQGLNTWPPAWKGRVLTTGPPPGKSPGCIFDAHSTSTSTSSKESRRQRHKRTSL